MRDFARGGSGAGNEGVLNMTDALYVLQSIDAAYESARTGRRVEVKYDV